VGGKRNEEEKNTDGRLEGLLRRWGSREAIRGARATSDEALAEESRPPRPRLWRPLAAAAGILILVGGGGFVAYRMRLLDRFLDQRAPSAPSAPRAIDPRLAEAERELAAAREALAAAERERAARKKEYDIEIARLAQEADAERAELERKVRLAEKIATDKNAELVKARADLTRAEGNLTKAEGDLARAIEALDENRKNTEALNGRLADLNEKLKAETARLKAENDRAIAARDAAVAAKDAALARLKEAEAGRGAMLAALEWAAAAGSTPGPEGLAARREIAKKLRLLERCGELRAEIRSAQTHRLFDTLEVVLTRLELARPEYPRDRMSFEALVRGTGADKEIDRILKAGEEGSAVAAWLLETRLLLGGLSDVG
jgi:DNA repair exonuclease SbcCD ATPase subunit